MIKHQIAKPAAALFALSAAILSSCGQTEGDAHTIEPLPPSSNGQTLASPGSNFPTATPITEPADPLEVGSPTSPLSESPIDLTGELEELSLEVQQASDAAQKELEEKLRANPPQ